MALPDHLTSLPPELLLHDIFPLLPIAALGALGRTCWTLFAAMQDETLWKRRLAEDYNLHDAPSTAREKGHLFLYKRMWRGRPFVWGSTGEGRLGLGDVRSVGGGILSGSRPWPVPVDLPGVVELVAGGWSFHALDFDGNVHVWGQLDGLPVPGHSRNAHFESPYKRLASPAKIILPEPIKKISCGRRHAMALGRSGGVYAFTSWGAPCALAHCAFAQPAQVECGWDYSAVLGADGDVALFWPLHGAWGERAEAAQMAGAAPLTPAGIAARVWEMDLEPAQVDAFRAEGVDEADARIVKIAAGGGFLLGLTRGGHVLKLELGDGPHTGRVEAQWTYLPKFSRASELRSDFRVVAAQHDATFDPPDALKVTHISAQFRTFFAYSTGETSVVLQGSRDTNASTAPAILPALQGRGVIAVVLGDWHFGALTASGQLLTWGSYSAGALGLGDPLRLPLGAPGGYGEQNGGKMGGWMQWEDPPDAREPSAVRFGTRARGGGEGRRTFVYAATASGWHTGALVIDLEDKDEWGQDT